ncbi:MAG: class I SAM-dependent methyltransferase [Acidiferrobacterales bacterium]|nr:class I SAM-dependent methyltransferase [Acidiferrobacterales bacterium]
MSISKVSKEEVLDANIEVHAALANSGEYNRSPHFNKENQDKVRQILEQLVAQTPSREKTKLLDMGCGTGFIIHLVADMVAEVSGVDITEDMMKQIDLSKGNISLELAQVEDLPFGDARFDMVTAYSFLDHLLDYRLALGEAYRVLKPGGIFYSGLNPNRGFSEMLQRIEAKESNPNDLPLAVSREIKGMLHNGEYHNEMFGVSEESLTKAEPEKSLKGGFDPSEVLDSAKKLGFSSVECRYDWFLGQGVLMNSDSNIDLNQVDQYLQAMLPASGEFYKYLSFVFVK